SFDRRGFGGVIFGGGGTRRGVSGAGRGAGGSTSSARSASRCGGRASRVHACPGITPARTPWITSDSPKAMIHVRMASRLTTHALLPRLTSDEVTDHPSVSGRDRGVSGTGDYVGRMGGARP